MQTVCTIDTAERTPGDAVQTFETDMVRLSGEVFGDPDFCILRLGAGGDLGFPDSPGVTRLRHTATGDFAVDSFFDVFYEITFEGCPGSVLEGFRGTSTGTHRMFTCDSDQGVPEPIELGIQPVVSNVVVNWNTVYPVLDYTVNAATNVTENAEPDMAGSNLNNRSWITPDSNNASFFNVTGDMPW